MKVTAFDIDQGWSRDVSQEVAAEIWLKAQFEDVELPDQAKHFISQHLPMQRPLPLRLVQ